MHYPILSHAVPLHPDPAEFSDVRLKYTAEIWTSDFEKW